MHKKDQIIPSELRQVAQIKRARGCHKIRLHLEPPAWENLCTVVPVQHDRSHRSFQKLLKDRRYLQKRAHVGLLWGGHKLILLLAWGRERSEKPEKGLRALVLGFLITAMEKRMGFFLLQNHFGWLHQPIIPYGSCFSQLATSLLCSPAEWKGFCRPVFPFLHKHRFCWVIYIL